MQENSLRIITGFEDYARRAFPHINPNFPNTKYEDSYISPWAFSVEKEQCHRELMKTIGTKLKGLFIHLQ